MKKITAILLALVLVLAMSTSAMADTVEDTITITMTNTTNSTTEGTVTAETYTAYKIFDVQKVAGGNGVAYSIKANSKYLAAVQACSAYITLTLSADGSEYTVTWKEGVDATNDSTTVKDFAALLETEVKKITNLVENTDYYTLTTSKEVAEGYYLITSTAGSNLVLATTDVTVEEKNDYPSLTKTVDNYEATIGDTVTFTIVVSIDAEATQAITVHDIQENGFTFKQITGVKDAENADVTYTLKNDTDEATDNDTADTCTFEVVIAAEQVKANAGSTITITYEAELDKDAELYTELNKNEAWLTYSAFTSVKSEVTVETYEITLKKTAEDKTTLLENAEFVIYKTETTDDDGVKSYSNPVKFVEVTDGYRVADSTQTGAETIVIDDGEIVLEGLGEGTYYAVETKAPIGYNLPADAKVIKVVGSKATAAEGDVVSGATVIITNSTGTELPSTGGMGTTLFYVVGGMMMAAAVVLLVAKKKVSAK